jgi:NAD(P)-dependent dehydrogenase (short-subunit alcohol dehydrogenase family)
MTPEKTGSFLNQDQKSRVWLITGCSSGLGKALAEEVLKQGENVVLTSRNIDSLKKLNEDYKEQSYLIQLDINNYEQIQRAISIALDKFGKIDVLVSNAGYGLLGALEEYTEDQIVNNIKTNFLSPLQLIKSAIPVFRSQFSKSQSDQAQSSQSKSKAHIINISAIAAVSNEPGFSVYGAAKAGLSAALEAVALELKPLGIHVTNVYPGPFRTNFLGSSFEKVTTKHSDYEKTVRKFETLLTSIEGKQKGSPQKAAVALYNLANLEAPPLNFALGKYSYEKFDKKIKKVEEELRIYREIGELVDF